MNNYRRMVTEAVTFARQSAQYREYRLKGNYFAQSLYLGDRFGTWVAYDAMKAMGHV